MKTTLNQALAQPEQEPTAYCVYFPTEKRQEYCEDLDELSGDLTNLDHEVTPLYTSPPPHHTLQERLAELHLYQEINEHYAKCESGAENLRDWVAERMNTKSEQQVQPDWLLSSTQELAKHIARRCYPEVPQFEVLSDLAGVISQIDNMITGMERKAPPVLQNIEQYRMQMAAISSAAFGYWKRSDSILPDYDTPALRDVAALYQSYNVLYQNTV